MVKWPPQEWIVLSPHDDKEEGEMAVFSNAVSVQICTNAHLVARTTSVVGWAVNGAHAPTFCLPYPVTNVRYPPDKGAVEAAC